MGFDAQRTVELAGTVLPCDRCGQFYNLIVIEELFKAIKEFVRYVLIGDRDSVGILECNLFLFIKQSA